MAPVVDSAVFRRKPLRVLHQGPFGAWLQYDALTYDVLTFVLFWAAGVAPEVRRALAEEMPALWCRHACASLLSSLGKNSARASITDDLPARAGT